MRAAHPSAAGIDRVTPAAWGTFGEAGPIEPRPFAYPIADFYRTDPISRASATMAEVQRAYSWRITANCPARTGTHG